MRYPRAIAALLVTIAMAACGTLCGAQPPTSDESSGPAEAANASAGRTAELRERKPELHYLLDANGKLVPVPSFRWEDFAKLLELNADARPDQQLPRAVVERLEITGAARDAHAELLAVLDVTVRDSQWHPLPLRFDRAVVREYRAEQGELRLEPVSGGGLLGWIKGEAAATIRIHLKLLRPLEETSADRRLTLSLPRAVSATLALQTPERNVTAELPEEQGLVEAASTADGSLLSAQLTSETLQLTWRAPPSVHAPEQHWLEATGELAVQVDSDGIATTGLLRLRSAGEPIDTIHVTLPKGAALVPGEYTGYALESIESAADAPQRVRVRLHEPNTVAEIRLQCRQDFTSAERSVDVGGFAVEEAVRQRGHVAFQVAGDVRAEWEERFLVRQIEELPTALRGTNVLAGFEYSGQPFSLLTRIAPRVTRLSVEPQYIIQVTAEELLLSARLRCRVRGGQLHQLQVDLGDWNLDEGGWENDGLVAEDEIDVDQLHPLNVPFSRAVEGEFELRIQARRPIESDADQIDFTLPRPLGTAIAPAQIVVIAGDNVRLTPRTDVEQNLVPQRPDATVSLPASRQPPRFYRGDVTQARFLAGYEIRPASLEASVRTEAEWADDHFDVRQVIHYRTENAPADRLRLRVPRALATPGTLQVRLLGDSPTPVTLDAAAETAELVLPAPQVGDFELEFHHRVPRPAGSQRLELPLVQPAELTSVDNSLRIVADTSWDVGLLDDAWSREAGESAAWSAKAPLPSATITFSPAAGAAPLPDLVERALVRTQLVNDLRQERVTWRVRAPDGEVTIQLPEGVLARDVIATLDGQATPAAFGAAREITIRWPARLERNATHLLVVDYHLEGVATGLNAPLTPVTLASPGWQERTDWELLLPEQVHLLDVSPEYAREFAWLWSGTHWTRAPHTSAAELRRQVGVVDESFFPSLHNRYVLSTFGRPRELVVQSMSRSTLILAASAVALGLGLTFLFWPALRRAEALLALAMALTIAVTWAGDSAILLLQAALPGFAAAAAALLVHRYTSRRRPMASLLQGSTQLAPRRGLPERTRGSSVAQPPSTSRAVSPAIAGESP